MLSDKAKALKKIDEIDFAVHELNLFLDSHPENVKATELLKQYRKWREDAVNDYEQKYGDYICTVSDVKAETPWGWIKGPWPWENDFLEEK